MKTNKTLLFGTVLAATGVAAIAGSQEAHASEKYTIQSGDTLYKISRKFTGGNGYVKQIADYNNIQNLDKIYAGQEILIPTEEEVEAMYAQAAQNTQAAQTTVAPATTQTQPAQQTTTTQVQQAPVAQNTQQTQATANNTQKAATTSNLSGSEEEAKAWIANKESTNNYNARNGRYIGKYQLDSSYLNGDYSPENQERVANNYVQSRYGSWANAKAFWQANGWY